ncbi:MAG: hypothetical protein PHN55_12900 [Dysgonamonadaceae bacterium]|nr:hypothetical protein [Dysgonamonadaceae bacterium]
MQKEKMFRKLYRGSLIPVEKSVAPSSEFQKHQHRLTGLEEEIEAMPGQQQKERFQDYLTTKAI